MRYVKPAVGTVCVGSAYGEAALLLAAGEKVPGSQMCLHRVRGLCRTPTAACGVPSAALLGAPPGAAGRALSVSQVLHRHSCVGLQGKRAALPSATIMIRQPIQRFQQMQASDIDIYRNEIRKTNGHIVSGACTCRKHAEHVPVNMSRKLHVCVLVEIPS